MDNNIDMTNIDASNEYEIRLEKLKRIQERDGVVYKDKFERTHTIKDARELPLDTNVKLCGRITAIRGFGKLIFARLYDVDAQIQFSISLNECPDTFEFFKSNVDVADYVGIEGELYNTHKGELTVRVRGYVILSKALRPLPEKWHGLTDTDKKFRQRYLDLIANEESREALKTRIKAIKYIRNYLDQNNFTEVETPILQNVASGAAAAPFMTHHNALDKDYYLRIAPELFLKQVIECGFDRVFELGKNFRNEGMDAMHLQEFTMLEWYASYWDYKDNLEFVKKMIQVLVLETKGDLKITYQGTELDFSKFYELDYTTSLNKELNCDILSINNVEEFKNHLLSLNKFDANEVKALISIPTAVDFAFKRTIRPTLVQPTVITNYPTFLIPLARHNDKDDRIIDMFQIAVNGAEIVKAYSELVNPITQRQAFEEQAKNKSAGDDESFEIDENFILAMEHGMPPMSGLGFGIDRFIAILADQPTLRDIVFFPQMR